MRTAYLDTLYDLAKKDKRVYALISDNGAIVYDRYRKDLPEQYLNLVFPRQICWVWRRVWRAAGKSPLPIP